MVTLFAAAVVLVAAVAARSTRHPAPVVEPALLKVRSFGKTSLREVKRRLADMGLSLGMDLEAPMPPADTESGGAGDGEHHGQPEHQPEEQAETVNQ